MSTAKHQSEVLMGELFRFAEKMLRSYGEFHPFGGYLTEAGRVVQVGVSADVNWTNDQQRADSISEYFQLMEVGERPLVFGIVTNVKLPNLESRSDAVRIFLEHKLGYCADVFFHYSSDAGLTITNITAQQGAPYLFGLKSKDTHQLESTTDERPRDVDKT